jgi:hypothetical protein
MAVPWRGSPRSAARELSPTGSSRSHGRRIPFAAFRLLWQRLRGVPAVKPPGYRMAGEPAAALKGAAEAERVRARQRPAPAIGKHASPPPVPGVRQQLLDDLATLCAAPKGRDSTSASYQKVARWIGWRLQSAGVLPAGDGRSGLRRYLVPIEWDQRFTQARGRSFNVVGIRHGDGSLNEAVLVIAHPDGLSAAQKRGIEKGHQRMGRYQGANDNASAVAAALSISDMIDRHTRLRGRPLKRDVIFLFPSAEEEGLKGAESFARFSRQFGGKKIVAAINFEMIGRGDPQAVLLFGGDTAAQAARNPVYQRALGLRSRPSMAKLVPGHEHDGGEHWYQRSDHAAFGGIPSVLYVGKPEDYHGNRDDFEHLAPRVTQAVARHALSLVVDLADGATAPAPGRALPIKTSTGFEGKVYKVAR